MSSQAQAFHSELFHRFDAALAVGKDWVEIHCGDIHHTVKQRLHFTNNRHATCSGVMWRETAAGYCEVVSSPQFGNGASLTIRYGLPRQPFTELVSKKREFREAVVTQLPSVLSEGHSIGRGPAFLRFESTREIHHFVLTEPQARHLAGQLNQWIS